LPFDGAREDERAGAVRDNEPYCVHATYTFDGSTPFAKRFRFAEFGLWDPESDQIESSANGENFRDDFLFRDDASGGKTSERKFLTYDPLSALETVFGVPFETFATFEPDIGRHLKAGAAQLRALRDAMAIAKVLNRTLAVPAPFCFCDKVWGGHDNIFAFNCHYPGSADSAHMPGACPLDHFVSPTAMRDAGVDFVAHGELPFFLEKTDTVLEVVAGAACRRARARRSIRRRERDRKRRAVFSGIRRRGFSARKGREGQGQGRVPSERGAILFRVQRIVCVYPRVRHRDAD
jgi:hypothetical protein